MYSNKQQILIFKGISIVLFENCERNSLCFSFFRQFLPQLMTEQNANEIEVSCTFSKRKLLLKDRFFVVKNIKFSKNRILFVISYNFQEVQLSSVLVHF